LAYRGNGRDDKERRKPMKVLMVPEFDLYVADRFGTRKCARCGHVRAILTLLPQSVSVPRVRYNDEVLVAARDYSSRSGLTFCKPMVMETSAPATLRYRDHRWLYLAAEVGVVPEELVEDCAIDGYSRLARFRDDYEGVKDSYSLVARKALDLPRPTEEAACPECRIAAIERARKEGRWIALQGNLEVYRADDVELDSSDWRWPWAREFFKYRIEGVDAGVVAKGRVALLKGEGEITLTPTDHPSDTVTVGAGTYWLYHPWPSRRNTARPRLTVKDILTDSSKWTRFADAIDAEGNECDVNDDRAVAFCLSGALRRAYSGRELDAAIKRIEAVIGPLVAGILSIRGWNDDRRRTFEDVRRVIALADAAAPSAEKESGT
jgi:hypothetical protein